MTEATIADRRVHPGTIALDFVKGAPRSVLAIPAAMAFLSDVTLPQVVLVALVISAVSVFAKWLIWSRFRYGVGERDIVIESGIMSRNRRSIPFNRIQDVDIERSMLARLFGLAKVKVETGAGGKDEGVIDSVTLAEADRLRAAVRAWREAAPLSHAPEAAEGQPPLVPPPAPPPLQKARLLFAMDTRRVLLFGLFNFSLFYIASVFALLQTFDNLLPFDIYDPARWMGLAERHLADRFTAPAIAAVLVLAVLLGIVAGLARTVARDHGYRLSLEGGRFRRERGLFTRSEAVIARKRVQLARVSTGPFRRGFGWYGLHFQTLGAASDASGLQPAAPFATRAEIEPILAETAPLRLPPPPALQMVSSRHVVRAMMLPMVPALAAVLISSLFIPPALYGLALLPLIGAAAALERRFHRYALDGELLFITRGMWKQQLWVVPVTSAQAISVSRSWLQRRLDLASVAIDTAGAPSLHGARIVDLRHAAARELAAQIAASRRLYSGRKSGTER